MGADPNPFRYCGEYFDVESGAYYLRARYYDPSIGRFTQEDTHWNASNMIYGDEPQQIGEYEDPLGTSRYVYAPQITAVMQAGNLYGYCSSNPVKWCDPTGNTYCDATKEWMCAGVPAVAISIPLSISLVELAKLGLTFVKELGAWVRAKIINGIWYVFFYESEDAQNEQDSPTNIPLPNVEYPGDDPTKGPEGTKWRGKGEPGSKDGAYYNPDTGESWHPDLDHPDPIGPHWDYNYKGSGCDGWRIYPDGRIEPK